MPEYKFKVGEVVRVVGGKNWDWAVESVQKAYRACIGLKGVVKRRAAYMGGTVYFEPLPNQYIHPYVKKCNGKWISFHQNVLARDMVEEIRRLKNERPR